MHLGSPIDSNNVIEIAQKVVSFYEGFLDEAESTLGK
jgi:hypothetical protein